jgi:hypothetical protein
LGIAPHGPKPIQCEKIIVFINYSHVPKTLSSSSSSHAPKHSGTVHGYLEGLQGSDNRLTVQVCYKLLINVCVSMHKLKLILTFRFFIPLYLLR